jgi:uncharacterized protein (DUF433 family)
MVVNGPDPLAQQCEQPHGFRIPVVTWRYSRMSSWGECRAVERDPEQVSGAWVFANTRVPVRALFENLQDGATVDQFVEWFPGVAREQAEAVLEFAAASLELQASA